VHITIVSAIFTTAPSTWPKRRQGECPVADKEASSSQDVLMQDNMINSFLLIITFLYVLLKMPCLYVKRKVTLNNP
jgi:hypothetical protein